MASSATIASATAAADPAGAALDVTITGLRSQNGRILACLTANPRTFPGCEKDPKALHVNVPTPEGGHLHFAGIRPGLYALAVIHDENGNGRMDMALFLPREGVGVSRNPRPRMGPPTFDSAAFRIDGADESLSVTMKYLL